MKTVGDVLDDIESGSKYPNPDEPCFVIRGRDPLAEQAILAWGELAINAKVNTSKIAGAIEAAKACAAWPSKRLPD